MAHIGACTESLAPDANQLFEAKSWKYPFLDSTDPRLRKTDLTVLAESIDLSKCIISDEFVIPFQEILVKNMDVFSLHDEIGEAKGIDVNIELTNDEPFFIHPYRHRE